jgi:hypothetical protein
MERSANFPEIDLKLGIMEVANGRVRLRYPELLPIGNYYLHAFSGFSGENPRDTSNRVITITQSEISAMPQSMRDDFVVQIPTTEKRPFFLLLFEATQP